MQPSEESPWPLFSAFLRLGCTSFGGPVAHLGYFRDELVRRRGWLTEEAFAETIALAQTLPGPASSQVAFAIGCQRGGWLGGVIAWAAFTLPSGILMLAFAIAGSRFSGAHFQGVLHGLQLVAIAVVTQAVLAMRRSLAPDLPRIHIAVAGAAVALLTPDRFSTLAAIALGALFGLLLTYPQQGSTGPIGRHMPRSHGLIALALFLLLLAAPVSAATEIFTVFYRSGSLVFGGGHVVLPVLESAMVGRGWLSPDAFLAGYGAAQALPGPLFTFAAYLGAVVNLPVHGIAGGLIALVALSLPGLLLMAAALPYWEGLRRYRRIRSVFAGINAAVVGVLAAALWRLLRSGAITGWRDAAVAAATLLLLARLQPWQIVLLAGTAGAFLLG